MADAAHVLFPNDVPKAAPDWFKAEQGAAEQRLMRRAEPAQTPQDGARKDDPAHKLFPTDAPNAPPTSPAVPDADAAKKLFGSEGREDYAKIVGGELDQYLLGAVQDGDTERADALRHATSALAVDMSKAGTDAGDFRDAMEIVRESIGLTPPTDEQLEQSFADGMAAVREAGISDADLSAARALIRDLEILSPGVVASLEANGAGNDIRLIRKVASEAKRRGY